MYGIKTVSCHILSRHILEFSQLVMTVLTYCSERNESTVSKNVTGAIRCPEVALGSEG